MAKTKLFLRRSKVNQEGASIIFVRYSHGDRSVDFSTGERVPAQYWDKVNQRVRKSYPKHNGINNFIEAKKNEVDNIRLDLKVRKIEPTVDIVKKEYLKEPDQPAAPTREFLMEYWDDFIS